MFIFGDNTKRMGNGGQAIIRGLSNAYGIVTKILPEYSPESFMNDSNISRNMNMFLTDLKRVYTHQPKFNHIIFPFNGIGLGLADLQNKAPNTLKMMNTLIREHFFFDMLTKEVLNENVKIMDNI